MRYSINHRVDLFKKYYKKDNDSPLLGFFIGSDYPLNRYPSMMNLPNDRPLKPDDFDSKAFATDCRNVFEKYEAFGGEFIWSASAFWGIPWIEVLCGMDIYANNKTGSIYAKIPAKESVLTHGFDCMDPWAILYRRLVNDIYQESKGEFPIGTTRMRGISDILSAVFPGDELIFRMLDDCDTVENISNKITELISDFTRFQLDLIPDFHEGIGSYYYNMWAPRRTVWLQEDAVALLSPDLVEKYIKPQVERLLNEFTSIILHQHPTASFANDIFLAMNFAAYEIHIDEGGPSAMDLGYIYNDILSENNLLIWGRINDEELKYIFNELDHRGLAVCCVVDSIDQANSIWEKHKT